MRRVFCGIGLALGIGAACLGGVKLEEDKPFVKKPRAGDVTGKITPPALIKQLDAISRVTEQRHQPTSFDRSSGKFVFRGLAGDARYDICVQTTDGRSLEGIDLDFLEQRWLRLAAARRKDLGLPPESDHKFSMDDVAMMVHHVKNMREFMEIHRPLYIKGHGKWATMLIELMRTREHYAGAGRLIWRVELWYWEYRHGGWERVINQERLLRRQRVAPSVWGRTHVEWFPQLSACIDPDGYSPSIEFKIPAEQDIRRGRLPNTEPVQKVKPFVLGLDVKPEPADVPSGTGAEKGKKDQKKQGAGKNKEE